jgi:hypothetical protein
MDHCKLETACPAHWYKNCADNYTKLGEATSKSREWLMKGKQIKVQGQPILECCNRHGGTEKRTSQHTDQ